jgi:hypothetical protein
MMVLDHSVAPAIVLVVEDEMLLRASALDMVEDAGFTSVEAADANEAVATRTIPAVTACGQKAIGARRRP